MRESLKETINSLGKILSEGSNVQSVLIPPKSHVTEGRRKGEEPSTAG